MALTLLELVTDPSSRRVKIESHPMALSKVDAGFIPSALEGDGMLEKMRYSQTRYGNFKFTGCSGALDPSG
jgi:hypothetical protein